MDVLLIAGLWLHGSAWDEVAAELRALGHRPVPLVLPGQGIGDGTATLEDQVAAVVAAVDAAERPLVVGHSAASSLAWLAADARPGAVAGAVLVGGFPVADGGTYTSGFEVRDGAVPFPGWDVFEGPDSADLDAEARREIEEGAIPVPEGVALGVVRLRDERRFAVPVMVVCPEFGVDDARKWIADGDVPELARARRVEFVDVDSGHWPMRTRPVELARILAEVAGSSGSAGDAGDTGKR
ncbi:alpha/beta fold hydrolase [Actinosynnema sp.]|uniref:alpha/beta fold hydrolase n=1 Tax=Actinosynnema sp. TaxID=1872144 RepID=UPI003F86508D